MRTPLLIIGMIALLFCGGTAGAAQKNRVQIELERIISAIDSPQMAQRIATELAAHLEPQFPEKKVPTKDATTVSLVGTVVFTDTDFLSDGTPITVGVMNVNTPLHQQVYFSCIGGSIWTQCISTGRRKLDGFLLAGDDVAFDAFLNLVIVTKLTK